MRVIEGLYDGVSTSELDNLAAETGFDDYCAQIMHNWRRMRFRICIRIQQNRFRNDD
jgi:hypothetical protein